MTTCSDSLSQIKSIVDEYVKLGFEGLFIRSLNPYGDAIKIGYITLQKVF